MDTLPVPPEEGNEAELGVIEIEQGPLVVVEPACVIVKVWPPMVMTPVRAAPVFAMTV
jgi:hypothetical protein